LIDIAWMIIIAAGCGAGFSRHAHFQAGKQEQTNPVMQAALVALEVYVLVW